MEIYSTGKVFDESIKGVDNLLMIKLTIVTPTYNRVKELKRNLESVKAQTFKDIEHIIVDNMSQDGTDELVEEYQRNVDYPVVYIREKDTGIYNAMNKGIKKARGEWVHILNSDDTYYSEENIECIVDEKNKPFDLLCGAIVIDNGKEGKVFWKPNFDEKINHYNFPHPGIVIKRDFYKTYGLYDERFKIVSDSIFGIKNYPAAKYLLMDETLVIMDGGGISHRGSFRNTCEFLYHLFVYHKFPFIHKLELTISHVINSLRMR